MSGMIYTIGHSTRAAQEFISLLVGNGVRHLVDIRTVPRSGHNPQFEGVVLGRSLKEAWLEHTHMPLLGGLRRAAKDSVNLGWRNESFRGFADYMQTPAFEEGLRILIGAASKSAICIMCAEAVPWRCHRSLIADALLIRGIEVGHIIGEGKIMRHELTSFAKVEGTSIWYPPQQENLF